MITIKKNLINVLLIVCSATALVSCSGSGKTDHEVQTEQAMVDSLQMKLDEVKGWLDKVTLKEIEERKEIIDENLEFIRDNYKGVLDAEQVRMLDDYKALEENYEKLSNAYKPIVTELEELYIQLKTLRQSAANKDYPKEEFKTYYAREKQDVENLHNIAAKSLKNFIDTDLYFERRQKEVEAFCESIKPSE